MVTAAMSVICYLDTDINVDSLIVKYEFLTGLSFVVVFPCGDECGLCGKMPLKKRKGSHLFLLFHYVLVLHLLVEMNMANVVEYLEKTVLCQIHLSVIHGHCRP